MDRATSYLENGFVLMAVVILFFGNGYIRNRRQRGWLRFAGFSADGADESRIYLSFKALEYFENTTATRVCAHGVGMSGASLAVAEHSHLIKILIQNSIIYKKIQFWRAFASFWRKPLLSLHREIKNVSYYGKE